MSARRTSLIRTRSLSLVLISICVAAALWLLPGPSIAKDKMPRPMADLRSDDVARKVSAAAELEKLGPQAAPAVHALVETLGDKDPEVRAAAARALKAIGPEASAAVKALVKLLEDRRFWVRDQAAEALASIGETATQPVIDMLKSGPPAARAGAALALGRMGVNNKAVLPALRAALQDQEPRVRATAAAELAQFGAAAVPGLAVAVADDDTTVVVAAAEALQAVHLNPEVAVPALARALARPESSATVARALQEYGTDAQSAVPALVRACPAGYSERISGWMYDKDAVVEALEHIGPARADDAGSLGALLAHENSLVRALAAAELAKLPASDETIDGLRRALRDPAALVRVHAARAIWLLTHESADLLTALEGGFDDGDYDTTSAAAETLAEIGEPAVPTLRRLMNHRLAQARSWVEDALRDARKDGAERVPDLIESLKDDDPRVCNVAAAALGRIGAAAAPAVPHLLAALNEKRLGLEEFTGAVQGIGPAAIAAKDPLIAALDAFDERARLHALSALCQIGHGDESIAAVAIAAIRDRKVRAQWGLKELGRLGPAAVAAVPFAIEHLEREENSIHERAAASAAELLGNIGLAAKSALPALRAALDDKDFSIRFEAAVAIWRISGTAEPMVKTLTLEFEQPTDDDADNSYFRRREALSRVRELGPGAAALVPALAKALEMDSDDLVIDAAEILGSFGPAAAEAVPALTKLSKKTDWPQRKAGLDALKKIVPNGSKQGK